MWRRASRPPRSGSALHGGGRTYEGLVAVCAAASRAKALLSFKRRHFDPPPQGVTIVEPSDRT